MREQQAKHTIYSRIFLLLVVVMMSLLFTLAVGFYAGNSITRPPRAAVAAFESAASRDLTPFRQVRNRDEVGAMAKAFDIAMQALRNGFTEAGDISRVLSTSADLQNMVGSFHIGENQAAESVVARTKTLEVAGCTSVPAIVEEAELVVD